MPSASAELPNCSLSNYQAGMLKLPKVHIPFAGRNNFIFLACIFFLCIRARDPNLVLRLFSCFLIQSRYTAGHIWACPPSEGDDYIFHCHPLDQKIPKPKRLQEWYKKMLDKAVTERIIHDYKVLCMVFIVIIILRATDLSGCTFPAMTISTCIVVTLK